MDADSIQTQVEAIIALNPASMTFGGETNDVGIANMTATDRQAATGNLKDYRKSVWLIEDDWSSLPEKGDKLTVDGTVYRLLWHVDYYLVVRRLDLGSEYPTRG